MYKTFKNIDAPEFISFLNNEYYYFFGIKNFDFINVSLAWHDKKDFPHKEGIRGINYRRPRAVYSRDNKEENLQANILHVVKSFTAQECKKLFEQIKLDKSYYTSLEQYLGLSDKLQLKLSLPEKINKI